MVGERYDAVVVGAGPVGAVCALSLARRGLSVAIIELEPEISRNPRAATTHPATLEMIDDVGLLDDVKALGLTARFFQFWDRVEQRRIATLDHEIIAGETRFPFVVQCEQHKLANLALDRLKTMPNVTVSMKTELIDFSQDGSGVTATVDADGTPKVLRARYLVGCDGGRSKVRKDLGIDFEGYTHPERFIVLTTPFDFEKEGYCFRNYLSDPGEWANLFKVTGDDLSGLWRCVFPTRVGETDEEALADAAAQRRLQGILKRDVPYDIVHRNIYNVHQRVAASFRKGRVLLAGDSAHVNNPIGGLGMNFGIHDAIEVAERLERIVKHDGDDEHELDAYDRVRRSLNVEYVQAQTVQNKKRLEERDPAVREQHFRDLEAIEHDPTRQKQFLMRSSLLDSVRQANEMGGRAA